ncbi:MAG: aspartate aminotransferase family protein [Deltaproteobacteria bacterium]|nr:aspartate aminotransferase family protein [Deltaproteobacteria bacterium]
MKETIKKSKGLLAPSLAIHTDIVAKKAHGLYVEAENGKTYMDFTSGLAVANIGHSHPAVVEAIKRQSEDLIHSGGIFYHAPLIRLAKKLKEITPSTIERFFFSNSGSEAVEGAIKLARIATGRQAMIAFTGSFHGRTIGALSLTSSAARYRKGYHPLVPSIFHAPYPYCYRCAFGRRRGTCSLECFDYLETTVLRHLITPEEVACIIIEPVLGEGGYVVPPKDYLKKLRRLCSRYGILFIADEVQTGFGRTGKWFAVEHSGIKPDIMVMAKAMANGLPISAVGAWSRLMEKWPPGAHGTTFGGNPVACSAALATMEIIEKQGLLKNAETLGGYALKRLFAMQKKYPCIGDVRGLGLMIAVEFVKKDKSPHPRLLKKIIKRCETTGLIIIECGVDKNVARLMPPLITTNEEMTRALDIFEKAVGACT